MSVLGWAFKKVQPKTRIVQAFPSWNPESGFDRRSVVKRHERLPRVPGASSLVFLFVPLGFIPLAGAGDPFSLSKEVIMNQDFWKTLHGWLNVAHSNDIQAKKRLLLDMHRQISAPGLRSDIQRILRLMDRELLARAEWAMYCVMQLR